MRLSRPEIVTEITTRCTLSAAKETRRASRHCSNPRCRAPIATEPIAMPRGRRPSLQQPVEETAERATTCYHEGAQTAANGRQPCAAARAKTPANGREYANNRNRRYSKLPRQAGGHWFEASVAHPFPCKTATRVARPVGENGRSSFGQVAAPGIRMPLVVCRPWWTPVARARIGPRTQTPFA